MLGEGKRSFGVDLENREESKNPQIRIYAH